MSTAPVRSRTRAPAPAPAPTPAAAPPPPPFAFPLSCVHGLHTPPPVSLRTAPRLVEALEAAFRRTERDERLRSHNAIAAQELLALQTVDAVLQHERATELLALYSVLRDFLVG